MSALTKEENKALQNQLSSNYNLDRLKHVKDMVLGQARVCYGTQYPHGVFDVITCATTKTGFSRAGTYSTLIVYPHNAAGGFTLIKKSDRSKTMGEAMENLWWNLQACVSKLLIGMEEGESHSAAQNTPAFVADRYELLSSISDPDLSPQ
ncbi:hypothetical protein P280DRAFT_521476 [Massarina eburnea CBS 473.64]|uniref:Uncharacterized protein n=1 Tax=Massarina eburnea CBS 473.64 TaxID=1395130 RepID=A0A6A6RNY9_9PLEO|nr:hypothetical protein P280DRAFT_521476 [Massarina eburnea CBS 473.64]